MKIGFTLIELLVVISMILTLILLSFPYYREAQKNYILENSAREIEKTIKRVREMAMSSREIESPTSSSQRIVPGGYGLYFESQEITIFADINEDFKYTPNSDWVLERVNIEPNTKILSSRSTVVFKPPHPIVILNTDPNSTSSTLSVTLQRDSSKQKRIRLNKTGLIYVE
jgi:Tfp pilus assembly protein FimT